MRRPSDESGTVSPDAGRRVQELFRTHAEVTAAFFDTSTPEVVRVAGALVAALRAGGKILFFGNGGSAADAQHLAAEFVNRFSTVRPALASLALTTDSSVLTSVGNDLDFTRIFSRQVEALGRSGDAAVGLSTSGRSPNVLEGLRAARAAGLVTVGLTGADAGPMKDLCQHLIAVPSNLTPRIQEVHILVGHILCQLVEETMFPPT